MSPRLCGLVLLLFAAAAWALPSPTTTQPAPPVWISVDSGQSVSDSGQVSSQWVDVQPTAPASFHLANSDSSDPLALQSENSEVTSQPSGQGANAPGGEQILSDPNPPINSFWNDKFSNAPGSLKVAESLDTSLFSGAASYVYPIEVPPGTHGQAPSVYLYYSSQKTQDQPSIVGTAFQLSQAYIERDFNKTLNDTSDDSFRIVTGSSSSDLVFDSSTQTYREKVDAVRRIELKTGGQNQLGSYWQVTQSNGNSLRFGFLPESEQLSDYPTIVRRWYLDLESDTHGNTIQYAYLENPFANESAATYPANISYNSDRLRVVKFQYETGKRPDYHPYYESGALVRQTRRLTSIQIFAAGQPVRSYSLAYSLIDGPSRSFLANITQYGSDGVTSLPPVSFNYTPVSYGWVQNNTVNPPVCFNLGEYRFEQGVQFADLNGDGLIDLLQGLANASGCTVRKAWLNSGNGWVPAPSFAPPECFVYLQGTAMTDFGLRLMEVNGDNLPDLVRANTTALNSCQPSTTKVWLNNGTGFSLTNMTLPECFAIPFSTPDIGTRIVDLNGDGKDDLVRSYHVSQWEMPSKAYLNTGNGWVLAPQWAPPESIIHWDGSGREFGVRIVDVNGDGLADLLKGRCNYQGQSEFATWLNNGSGWNLTTEFLGLCFSDHYANQFVDLGWRFWEANGDGLIDLIVFDQGGVNAKQNTGSGWVWNHTLVPNSTQMDYSGTGVRLLDLNGDGSTDLLTKTGNASCTINYSYVSTNTRSYLLSSIRNSLGGNTRLSYIPSTSVPNYGNDARPDLSFNLWLVSLVEMDDGMANSSRGATVSRTWYSYANGSFDPVKKEFRGFANSVETRSDNSSIRHYFLQDEARQGRQYLQESFNASGTLMRRQTWAWVDTLQPPIHVVSLQNETLYEFDGSSTPRVGSKLYAYDAYSNPVSIQQTGDLALNGDERISRIEYAYNPDLWLVSSAKRVSQYAADNVTLLRESTFFYDNAEYGVGPVKGDLTRREDWLAPSGQLPTTFAYDALGNKIRQTDSNGHSIEFSYGVADPTYTFPEKITNAKAHEAQFAFDLGTGNLLAYTDPNGYSFSRSYDVFGRLQSEVQPYDTGFFPSKQLSYERNGIAPETVSVKLRENAGQAGTFDSEVSYDGFGRPVRSWKESEIGQGIVANTFYDVLGRESGKSNPYIKTGSVEPVGNRSFVSYDALGRPVVATNADGTSKRFSYDRGNVVQWDENGNRKGSYADVYGQIASVTEYDPEPKTTYYIYDSVGQMTQIRDALGNTFNFSYDSLGRKTAQQDPDLGNWQYAYDAVGNLVSQTDARGLTTLLAYDELDRPVSKSAPNAQTVTYAYDVPVKGTLSSVQTSSYAVQYGYDQRLRKVSETASINGRQFTTLYAYDSLNRLVSKTLPSGETLVYTYTAQNQPESLSGVISSTSHNELDKELNRSYANGLTTRYSFQPLSLRLFRITTGSQQDLTYSYDGVGNVLSISDAVHSRAYANTYDALHRLVSTSVSLNGGSSEYYHFSYDILGRLLQTTRFGSTTDYSYGLRPVHAPRQVVPGISNIQLSIDNFSSEPFGNGSFINVSSLYSTWNNTQPSGNWSYLGYLGGNLYYPLESNNFGIWANTSSGSGLPRTWNESSGHNISADLGSGTSGWPGVAFRFQSADLGLPLYLAGRLHCPNDPGHYCNLGYGGNASVLVGDTVLNHSLLDAAQPILDFNSTPLPLGLVGTSPVTIRFNPQYAYSPGYLNFMAEDLRIGYFSHLQRQFSFTLRNSGLQTLNNVTWQLDTGEGSVYSQNSVSLAPEELMPVSIVFNYSHAGSFTANLTAYNGNYQVYSLSNVLVQ